MREVMAMDMYAIPLWVAPNKHIRLHGNSIGDL